MVLFLKPSISSTTFLHSHLSVPAIMQTTPVVTLKFLSFDSDQSDSTAMVGMFTATTDSRFEGPIEVEAVIIYRGTTVCVHDVKHCWKAHWMTDR